MYVNPLSFAIYGMVLFPVLPLSVGLNGFLAQATFSIPILLSVLLGGTLPPILRKPWVIIILLYLVILVGMSFRGWANEFSDFLTLVRFMMPLAAIVAGYQLAGKSPEFIRKLIVFLCVSLLVIHLLVISGVYEIADVWYYRGSDELGDRRKFYHIFRASGFMGYPSEAGIILSVLLLIYVALKGSLSKQPLAITALVFLCVMLTQSRAAIALLFGVIVTLLFYLDNRRHLLIVFAAIIYVASHFSYSYLTGSFNDDWSQTNLATRASELLYMKAVILDGLQTREGVSAYREFFGVLESNYLTLYLRGGLLASLSHFVVMLTIGISVIRLRLSRPSYRAVKTFTGVLFIVNALVLDFFTGVFTQGKSAVLVWSLWGVVLGLRESRRCRHKQNARR